MSAAQASTTCSQLSTTSSTSRSARKSISSPDGSPEPVPMARRENPTAEANAPGTTAASPTGARSTKNTPSGNRSSWSDAASIASLVLPQPPTPVSVTRRRALEVLPHHLPIVEPADERRAGAGQVGAHPQRTQRGEVVGKVRVEQLVHALGPGEVPQAVQPEVAEGHAVRRGAVDQLLGGLAADGLPAVRDRAEASGAVRRDAEVVALPQLGVTRVERGAHTDLGRPQARAHAAASAGGRSPRR